MKALVAFLLLSLPVSSFAAEAPEFCDDQQKFEAYLAEEWGETRRVWGLQTDGSMIQIFVAPDGGTWTILKTFPGQSPCWIANGDGMWFVPQGLGS